MSKVYQKLATAVGAQINVRNRDEVRPDLEAAWDAYTKKIMDGAPSGSGIDSGTKLLDASTPECLAFQVDFHHMDENGFYCGWTEHIIRVRPSLQFGFLLTISGRNPKGIKEYLNDVYYQWLGEECPVEYKRSE